MTPSPSSGIRSDAEQVRVQERLLIRGNTLGGVVEAAFTILLTGGEVPHDQLTGLRDDLRGWTADVRAVASEEAP